jgi:predicted AlkP superfamily pyrophosphatase or phosphodiesterase
VPWISNVRIPNQQSKNSPALAEFRGELHLCHAGDSSNDIWHSVFDGAEWNENKRIPGQKSKAPSALASFQNRLHIAHLGDSSNKIWHSSFDGTRWIENDAIEGALSQAAPAMAVFADRLHLLHIGNSSHRIYHLEFDGLRWQKRPDNEGLENQRSKGAVALAVFDGELHMVHQGDTSNRLWHTRFNGNRWSENEPIEGQLSKSPPALATLSGLLHLLHLGDSSNRIWHSTFDGATWAQNIPIPYQLSKAAPALASFSGRLHMAHLGDSSNDIWYSSSDGILVRRPDRRVFVVDLDGVRWDSFYRHLKRVRDAGASADVTYNFSLPPGASDDTILGDGDVQLRSALAELCFAPGNGMTDVRLALAAYPSFTFPSHGTMYTGIGPGRHGIAGHTFMVRDAPPEWDRHSWDSLPRALALQGYCTDADSSGEALADYLWGGFDTVDGNSCRNRNRGIVSDLRVANMFEHAHGGGLRSCSIHSFYHGALRPWDNEGWDQWVRYSPRELRSIKDVCSDEDLDQYETVDHGALAKADLLLQFMPSKIQTISPDAIPASIVDSTNRMTGERNPGWTIRGEAHPDGIPDLVAIYLASADNASHINGIRDQETYLAWFDHRLGRFVRELKRADPETFENTVFAFVADHGHAPIAQAPESSGVPSDNALAVREELVRILFGDAEGQQGLDLLKELTQMNRPGYGRLVSEAIEDDFRAWAEAMNLYVYVRNPDQFPPVDVARRLLAVPMRTEPYGALVLVRGQYHFLARGESSPAPLDNAASRAIVIPQLDVPPATTADIDATSLSQADAAAEQSLRQRLNTDEAFALLQVAERVAGFNPVDINQSPDVILLAPAGRSFSGGAATHGSFAYSASRIPMVFCGPGMPEGRAQIDSARMIDFAPTVLSLLGLQPEGLDGQALLDRSGQVVRGPIRSKPGAKPCAPPGPAPHRETTTVPPRRVPRVTVVLHPSLRRLANMRETAETSELPVLVAIALHAARVRRAVVLGEASYIEARSAMTLVAGRDETWMEIEGKRQVLKTGTQIAMDAVKRFRILSKHSYDSIDVERAYVVQPLAVALPRVPQWLRHAIDDLARTGRILIDDRQTAAGTILVAAADFAQAVEFLEAQLGGDQRPDRLIAKRLSDIAKVKRAMLILESILDKPTVSGLDTTPGHVCAA